MKYAPPALIAALPTLTEANVADLITVTLPSGMVIRATSYDGPITYNGNVYLPGPPYFKRGKASTKLGFEVATLDMTIGDAPSELPPVLIGTIPLLQSIRVGVWQQASIVVDKLFMQDPGNGGTAYGTINVFTGVLGNVTSVDRVHAVVVCKALTILFDQQFPRNIIQPGCRWTLFSPGCTLHQSSFAVSATVVAGSTQNKIASTLSNPDGYFNQGQVVFTSGPNVGLTYYVDNYVSEFIYMAVPMLFAPNGGDTFTAYPGCDKTQATCSAKFNNLINFSGLPYVPAPETAY